jgi:integrase
MKIYLRMRKSTASPTNGKKPMSSLYLTIKARPGAKLKYEWLGLHIYEKPKTNLEKDFNKETLLLAESIRAKRLIDMQTTANGFVSSVKSKISFLDYFQKLTENRAEESDGNGGNWKSTYEHLKSYCDKSDPTLEQIDENFLEGFKEYLLKNIARRGTGKLNVNSAQSYFNKVRASLREAHKNKMIKANPCLNLRGIKGQDTARKFLTLDEIKKLSATPCENQLLKQAFLFSCLTGLRWSDVMQVSWDKIEFDEAGGYSIHYAQQKTKSHEVLPVSQQAILLLPPKNTIDDDEPIFKDLKYSSWLNNILKDWIADAGIKKKITFHCARHSFATLNLTLNTDIYTVSKLLGHKNLKTTEIYAKIVDEKKVEAVSKLNNIVFA